MSCTSCVLSQASLKYSTLHTIFRKEVKQSQQNYHTVGLVNKKLIRQCYTKGTRGILRTLQTEYTLALETITIAPCCGKNQVLKISNQGPPRPQSQAIISSATSWFQRSSYFPLYTPGSQRKISQRPWPQAIIGWAKQFLVLKRSCVPFSCYQGLWERLSSSAQLQYKHIRKAIQPSLPSILRTQNLSLKTSITRNPTFSTLPSPWQVAFYFLIK